MSSQIHLNSFGKWSFSQSDIRASSELITLNIAIAYQYIIDRYDSHHGLVSENEYTDKYWLWSDNVLAAEVLMYHNDSLYKNIVEKIKSYIEDYKIKPQTPYSTLITAPILAYDFLPPLFNASRNLNPTDNIWYSDYNGNVELRCSDYADIAFLKSIHFFKIHRTTDSKLCYEEAMHTFDGAGFRDKSYFADGAKYSTYKIALWKIASGITGFGPSNQALDIISKMQNYHTGGVYTFYSKYFIPEGQTNVETTALAIIANT